MIWNPLEREDDPESAVAEYLAAEVAGACNGESGVSAANLQELARAIEFLAGQNPGDGGMESSHVLLLASQALTSLGEGTVARRLVVFGSGLVRASVWEAARSRNMWVLDLKRMMVREDAWLEMIFFGSLSVVLESLADVWDESKGRGTLGLRHVCAAASGMLGKGGKKQVAGLAGEILDWCGGRLKQIGGARGWTEIPEVLNLDVG